MSNSKYSPDWRKAGKLPEKSNFAQTCNLLSQVMNVKGNPRNLGFGKGLDLVPDLQNSSAPQTMNLLNAMEKSADGVKAVKAGQMTIFYNGQVLVFDDFPAEKLDEIVLSATTNNGGFAGKYTVADEHRCSTSTMNPVRQSNIIDGSDMPIARRASLNRFLEKRKDRSTVRAPYQLQNPYIPSPKPDERREQFDLNL